jgi:hypothetical protein
LLTRLDTYLKKIFKYIEEHNRNIRPTEAAITNSKNIIIPLYKECGIAITYYGYQIL